MAWRLTQLIYLMAPAYVANMTPPFARFWTGWNRPINDRWLGSHKTIVGAVAGIVGAVVTTLVQSRIGWRGNIVTYEHWLTLGMLLGVGAIGGDAAKSFLKRRRGIAPGARWIPLDQLDFVIGALLLVQPLAHLAWRDVALLLAVTFVGDVAVNHLAFHLRIRATPW